jgi:hypothetical protein
MGDGPPEVAQPRGQANNNDNLRLLEAFLNNRPEGGLGGRGSRDLFRLGTPANQDTYNQTQRWLDSNPAAAADLRRYNMTPWAERSGARSNLMRNHPNLAELEDSALLPAARAQRMPMRLDTRMCHDSGHRSYEPAPPEPYRIGDLILPTPNQAGLDAMSARTIQIGNAGLNQADRRSFATAVNEIAAKNTISLADRTNILCRLSVMMSHGDNRSLPDETSRRVALGLAQAIAHPPNGATGDLRLAGTNPAELTNYALQMATRGRATRDGVERELSNAARQQVREATTPHQALDRLLGSTRVVTPESFNLDMTSLDRPAPFLNEGAIAALRELHEQDGRIRSIRVSHLRDGDDRISIGLEAGRTEGDIALSQNLGMTVHREADGSYKLTNMSGIEYPTALGNVSVTELRMGRPGDAGRRIVGTGLGLSIDVTDKVQDEQIKQFDAMIQMLNGINQQRQR